MGFGETMHNVSEESHVCHVTDKFIVHAWYILGTDAFLLASSCAFFLCLFFFFSVETEQKASQCMRGMLNSNKCWFSSLSGW